MERFIRFIAKSTGLWQLDLLWVPFLYSTKTPSEPQIETKIRLTLGEDWTFVDVGASFGYYMILAAKIVGSKGLVISLEPAVRESHVIKYSSMLYRLRNVVVLTIAAYSENSKRRFYISEFNGLHSLSKKSSRESEVTCLTLDTILSSIIFPKPLFIKIDVEGAETEVLVGTKQILSSKIPMCFLIELHSLELVNILLELLTRFGFVYEYLNGSHVYAENQLLKEKVADIHKLSVNGRSVL